MTSTEKRKTLKYIPNKSKWGLGLAIIPLIGYAIFGLLPLILSVVISLFDLNGYRFEGMEFVGFNNFSHVITDPLFYKSILNTLYAMLSIPITIGLSLLIATVLMNPKIKGKAAFRTIFFIPYVCSVVAVSIMWRWLLDGEYGTINQILSMINIDGPDWLGDSRSFMPAMIMMSVWGGLGFNVILFSAALTNVDHSLYEAAQIDGAGTIRKFVSITLPSISPVTFYILVISLIGGLQDFARFQIMAPGGGPDNAGLTVVYYLYNAGFTNVVTYGMGIASAVSWVLTIIIASITAMNFIASKKWVANS
ncbi:carbohydrate ABC transporter permease [Acholeplasma granularum]|uniref:carbohydrate ABC transporter permease n=1 Tax=Acholeplasma granularum TaxID=264635 RepID=UPI0004B0DDF1|nr:sugar ABC transporter permease [Acholeplasma granularum]